MNSLLRHTLTRKNNVFNKKFTNIRGLSDAGLLYISSKKQTTARFFSTENHEFQNHTYHAGLKKTGFTNDLNITNDSPLIPIFRVLGYDGKIIGDWDVPFNPEECVEKYKFMVNLSVWDMMLYNIQRQGRISFYMQNQGEEPLQTAVGSALKPADMLWCQYRELGVLLSKGFTIIDALNQLFSTSEDPGKGRQMPISYTKKEIGLQSIATPLTTQLPHAAGSGYAFKLGQEDRVSVAFFGEGAASEGDFHAAMNFAATLKSQTMFVCRNNGYAISTPVEEQYAGDGIAIRGLAYGMHTIRVDGNDFFASYYATKKARELCVEKSTPVCLEFMTYRQGHHSTSDDSNQYRPNNEASMWLQPGVNDRFRMFLESNGLWDDQKEETLRKQAKSYMLKEIKLADVKKAYPIIPGMFDDVYDERPWNVQEQSDSLRKHLDKNLKHYDMSKYPGLD